MVPVVSLAGPKDLLATIDKLPEDTRIVHKLLRFLFYKDTQLTRFGIHCQQLVEMMPALVILHRYLFTIFRPLHPLQLILVF